MKVEDQTIGSIEAKYKVIASSEEINMYKDQVVKRLRKDIRVPGFRPGKAPDEMVEKYIDPGKLQTEFLNEIINTLYLESIELMNLRIVNEPQLDITKFVPYQTLEFSVNTDIISKVIVGDYRKFKLALEPLPVTKKQLDATLNELRGRTAKITQVDRAAKLGDQVLIDFKGSDTKTKKELHQASGMDYKLILGSNNFVPGFEQKLIGLKSGETTTFSLTFPKDYHDTEFKSRKVTFEVTVHSVSSVELPKLDDAFATSIGPFKNLKEFEAELNKQLKEENDRQANRQFEDKILNQLAESTKVEIPPSLVESEVSKLEAEAKQSAVYRGQSWREFLSSIDTNEEGYHEQLRPLAELRIRGGLAIGEIARNESIDISQKELDDQIARLKKQYSDEQMQAELDNPTNRRELLMRMLSEKVLSHIKNEITKQPAKPKTSSKK